MTRAVEAPASITGSPLRILLVEDERKLAESIARHLQGAGYEVEHARDGEEALARARSEEFHLIILDLNLPKRSGFDVLAELRSEMRDTPVLILSAREEVTDRVEGLRRGADDYLVKPFDVGELTARIEAILRRAGHERISVLRAKDLVMDVVQRKVWRADEEIFLSPREFALLKFFLRNKNRIVTRRRIAEQVWGYTFDTGTNIVDVYVSYLRKAVDAPFDEKLIHTVVREGFVLRDE